MQYYKKRKRKSIFFYAFPQFFSRCFLSEGSHSVQKCRKFPQSLCWEESAHHCLPGEKAWMAGLIPVVFNKAFAQDLPHIPHDDESVFVQLVDQFF